MIAAIINISVGAIGGWAIDRARYWRAAAKQALHLATINDESAEYWCGLYHAKLAEEEAHREKLRRAGRKGRAVQLAAKEG